MRTTTHRAAGRVTAVAGIAALIATGLLIQQPPADAGAAASSPKLVSIKFSDTSDALVTRAGAVELRTIGGGLNVFNGSAAATTAHCSGTATNTGAGTPIARKTTVQPGSSGALITAAEDYGIVTCHLADMASGSFTVVTLGPSKSTRHSGIAMLQ